MGEARRAGRWVAGGTALVVALEAGALVGLAEVCGAYAGAVTLLAPSLLLGALALVRTALRGPTTVTLLTPLACGLVATPVITEPALGRDYGGDLLPLVAPMVIGGAVVAWIERGVVREVATRAVQAAAGGRLAVVALALLLIGVCAGGLVAIGLADPVALAAKLAAIVVANVLVYGVAAMVIGARGRRR